MVSDSASGCHQETVLAPASDTLSSILMTDSGKESIDKCFDNLAATKFLEAKVELGLLDWDKSVQADMKNQFDFIIGCDCAQDFSPLAKTVAHSLKYSPTEEQSSEQSPPASFVYIGPEYCDGIPGLVSALGERYQMGTFAKEIVLERIQLLPFVSDSDDEVEVERKTEIEDKVGGHVEYENMDVSRYTAIVGYHVEDVHHLNVELSFPAEEETWTTIEQVSLLQSGNIIEEFVVLFYELFLTIH